LSGFLDITMVVRYLTGDPPELAEKAACIIDGKETLQIMPIVLCEAAYMLASVYKIPRSAIIDHLIAFLQKKNMSSFALDKALVLEALLACKSSERVDFADAMVWAAARSSESKVIYSLNERFPEEGVEVRQELYQEANAL
jgi:predicted nucleic-acid-binding protein